MKLNYNSFWEVLKGTYESDDTQDYSQLYEFSQETQEVIIKFTRQKIDISGVINREFIKLDYSLHFYECEFIDFHFTNIESNKDIIFDKCKFVGETSFHENILEEIKFYLCNCSDNMIFRRGNYKNIYIRGIDTTSINRLLILEGVFEKIFIDSEILNIEVTGITTIVNEFIIKGHNKSKIDLLDTQINNIKLMGKYNLESNITLSNVRLSSITLENLYNKGELLFNNIYINKAIEPSDITIESFLKGKEIMVGKDVYKKRDDLDNQKAIRYIQIMSESNYYQEYKELLYKNKKIQEKLLFKIYNSQLGIVQFKNFDLNNFEEIEIIDTDLSTLKTFNSTFPINKIKGNDKYLYEVFNDLYTVSKNKNNKREQVEYYKASKRSLFKSFEYKTDFSSKTSLYISKLYSNFGTSWLKGLGITFCFALVFFASMLLLSNYDVDFSKNGCGHFVNVISYFFQYLNPVHRIDFMDKTGYEYSTDIFFVVLDFFGRIFISIGIFEIVLSFRKFVRN